MVPFFTHETVLFVTDNLPSVPVCCPDLSVGSPIATNADAWKSVVLDGVLAQNGMVSFAEYLNPEEAEAIRAYVVSAATERYARARSRVG